MENKSYSYPMDYDWTKEEMTKVINLWRAVELAYEIGIKKEQFMISYREFKEVIPSIGEEKKWCRQFESISGYSVYAVYQEAKKLDKKNIFMDKSKGSR
ncbi:Uncharacterized protein YktA, UPF0223 family [Carnobacterium iners]|uniref:Uncharacterized protein YktA, UPF0223 family n=1 Tax=Carnobacterium iners TaxID=1073423 RepID=A0A1X7NL90_9LACT|nr:UPF0223 family protein [Carnobacterium iners]SEK70486.1 Uncharacterized protein YktA, UPF0223 family [Carnobacterium iners]SMH38633.1 Uncharacterized protein YktA, UPF0223 family [Carnobacterium iners]